MKTTSPQRRLALAGILGAVSFLSACSSGVKLDDLSTVKAGGSDGSNFASQPWNDPKSPLFQRSIYFCLLYTSPSPRDRQKSRMPSSA